MWDLPGPGIEPVSPALAGRFLTTAPPGKSLKVRVLLLWHFLKNVIYLFIYFWLCWVFVSVRGLSLVVTGGGHSSSRCTGLSLSRPLFLRSTGSRRAGSVIVAHGPSCSAACGIFPDQGSNPCPLHWQADSQPLLHQGSPSSMIFDKCIQCATTRIKTVIVNFLPSTLIPGNHFFDFCPYSFDFSRIL